MEDLGDKAMRYGKRIFYILVVSFGLTACGSNNNELNEENIAQESMLRETIISASANSSAEYFLLPAGDDYGNIPQDIENPLTAEKVELGKMIFHDTGFALNGVAGEDFQTWSCASCHHARAGFKSGVVQGIGEGGAGFHADGSGRFLLPGFDGMAAEGADNKPDTQPLTSPAVLNVAYQEVMLWNGQFGNARDGVVNSMLPADVVTPEGTPIANNRRELSGIEIQAIAGAGVHRLRVESDSPLQTVPEYQQLWNAAFPDGSTDVLEDAGKAIAAFERTIVADQSPFQLWLRDEGNLNDAQLRGGILFFGKAGCSGCHTGPALSSPAGAEEAQVFAAIGLNDFDVNDPAVTGEVDERSSFGRGGFTGEERTRYQFKIPQLYNLADTNVFGHGGSIRSIRDMVVYKNLAIAQNQNAIDYLDNRFVPLGLNEGEVDDLTEFMATALYDNNLMRYQPERVPSNKCVIVDPIIPSDEAFETLCDNQSNSD